MSTGCKIRYKSVIYLEEHRDTDWIAAKHKLRKLHIKLLLNVPITVLVTVPLVGITPRGQGIREGCSRQARYLPRAPPARGRVVRRQIWLQR